jgi:hypothetical protein
MQQQQRTAPFTGLYRTQVESAQDVTAASMEGLERIQQLALQAWRQQVDSQLRLVHAITSKSAEAIVDPDVARPALDRMIDVQRQLADTVVRTNQRVLSVVTSGAQRAGEQAGAQNAAGERGDDLVSTMFQSALSQWQEMSHRMLDAFHEQFVAATSEVERQGNRVLDQASQALEAAGRPEHVGGRSGEQGGAQQGAHGQNQSGKGQKTAERKHETA